MTEQQDYYKVGSREDIVVSNSSLSYINPLQNGSPVAFLDFFEEKQEKEKNYYRMGHLIHKWAEDRESFVIAECPRPSEIMGLIADRVIAEIEFNGVEFTRELASDISLTMNYQKNWKPETRLKNVYDGIETYINDYINREEDKTYLTEAEYTTVKKSTEAVEKHPVAKELLFMQDTDFSNKKVYRELEIYWNKVFPFHDNSYNIGESRPIMLKFKAKLDSLVIDFDSKVVTYTDPKTSSAGAYSFGTSFSNYKYYRQQAFYNWAIREFSKQQEFNLTGFTFLNRNIVIETNNLFQVTVYNISEDWLKRGTKEYQELVKRLVYHTATNQWNYSLEEMSNNLIIEIPYEEE